MNGRFEILAPGGSPEGIKAAINAGADAVYTGGKMFGAREYADNLDVSQMEEALEYAHLRNRKVYLTVNTLLKDSEIEEKLYDYLYPFYCMGMDAVIVQDFGVLKFIHDNFKNLPIHASTQMCILGSDTAKWLKDVGVSRIVTPREMSVREIKDIYDNTGLEIESFVHGALCYSYSGMCMLSSFIGGRSGNRGKCAQPCRLEYDVIKDNKLLNPGNNKYVLSPKDICTLDMLKDLDRAGVYSLKIEGRMKKPEYAAGVTNLYRKYADIYSEISDYAVDDKDYNDALSLFNRHGFSKSYYKIHNSKDMITLKKPEFRQEDKELTERINNCFINNEIKVGIDFNCLIKQAEPIKLTSVCNGVSVTTYGQVPDVAKNRPIDSDTVKSKLLKVGETDFKVNNIDIIMDDNLFITIGAINELRRNNLEELKNKLLLNKKRNESLKCNYFITDKKTNADCELKISVLISNVNQFEALKNKKNLNRIYVESETVNNKQAKYIADNCKDIEVFLAMPRIFRMEDKEAFAKKYPDISVFDGFLIRNIEEYFYIKKILKDDKIIMFDYSVYSFNRISKSVLEQFDAETTIPLELNEHEIMKRGCDGEMICYGYVPVMITANCLNKTCAECNRKNDVLNLKDRKGFVSNVRCVCEYCYNVIYNSKPISLLNYREKLLSMGIRNIRLDFTFESHNDVDAVIDKFIGKFIENKDVKDIDDSTRGHFKRGVS